jgi:ribosomal protein S18 acetylase RimI-like enzyme
MSASDPLQALRDDPTLLPMHLRMTHVLGEHPASPRWPAGVHVEALDTSEGAEAHRLLTLGYRDGVGSVEPYAAWWAALTTDTEYDPALCFVAKTTSGQMVGFAQCWTSAFIKDLAVHPAWRRRGIGGALIRHVFVVFKQRGAISVDLKVEVDNPSGAVRLYERAGMRPVGDVRN